MFADYYISLAAIALHDIKLIINMLSCLCIAKCSV